MIWIICFFTRPRNNGDLLGYTAAVIALDGGNPEQVHRVAYDCLNCCLPAEAYHQIADGSPHRQAVARSPELLGSVLPIYRARIAYVWPAWLAWKCGLPPVRALTVLPVIAMMGSAVALYWLAGGGTRAAIIAALCVWLFDWLEVASYATSDAIACLSAVLFLGAVVKRRWWWMIPAAMCLCSRIDLVLLMPVGLWAWGSWRFRGIMMAGLFVLYMVLSNNYPGWSWQFANEFLGRMDSVVVHVDVTWDQYEAVLRRGMAQMVHWPAFGLMVALSVVTMRWDRRWVLLAVVPLMFVTAHIALYPAVYARFFAWCGAACLCSFSVGDQRCE